jgi:PAS domain S-box-containing protein
MSPALRILIAEDSTIDAEFLVRAVRRGGYDAAYQVVDTHAAMRAALEQQDWDVITSDNNMPEFSATAALALAQELRPGVPFIIVSGEINLSLAVSLMKGGARDYIDKRQLERVVPALERELREVDLRRQQRRSEQALQVSETRYRRLFETAQDGILILDAHSGRILDVNPFLIEMLGYPKQELLGKELGQIGPFRGIDESQFAFTQLHSQGYIRYDDLPLEARDGSLIAVEFVSNSYLVDGQQVIQCNIRDNSARKQAETSLRNLNAELEQRVRERTVLLQALNKDLEAFNYSVSHDLRAPLRRIAGLAGVVREDCAAKLDAKDLGCLDRIKACVQDTDALIDALMELGRVARTEMHRDPVDLSALAHAVASELQQQNTGRKVELCVAEGIKVDADARLLRIVLENLLGNAWKFTARIAAARIELGSIKQADGNVACFVRDNGAGFDMAYADKMFAPFQRLHNVKDFPGTGIGLATVERIIHRHAGRIWAESAVDAGTTIYFTLSP